MSAEDEEFIQRLGPDHWRERLESVNRQIAELRQNICYRMWLEDDSPCDDDEWGALPTESPETLARDKMFELERVRNYVLWCLEKATRP